MKSWEQVRKEGLERGRSFFAESRDSATVDEALARWRGAVLDESPRPSRPEVAQHPATHQLSQELVEAGADDVAAFLRNFTEVEGPIHPGQWGFSFLLGRSFAPVFIEQLRRGELQSPMFYGLEQFGAWDSFIERSIEILRDDPNAKEAAIALLAKIVAQIETGPSLDALCAPGDQIAFQQACERYSKQPNIDEAWESHFCKRILFRPSFFIGILLEVDPAECMQLIGELPHPAFLQDCFEEGEVPAARVGALTSLLAAAPEAFDNTGAFQSQGMVTVALLNQCAKVLQTHRARLLVPKDRADDLAPLAENAAAVATQIADTLMQRTDATPLAWAWLDRLMFEGIQRDYWDIRSCAAESWAVDPLLILISKLSARLESKSDFATWVDEKQRELRIDRLFASLAVALWGAGHSAERVQAVIEWGLCNSGVRLSMSSDAVDRTPGVVRRVGGEAVVATAAPARWFSSIWDKIRPVRERTWRKRIGGERQNVDEICVLCGLGALEVLSENAREELWQAVEESIRDGLQTDDLPQPNSFWARALVRVFRYFPRNEAESPEMQTKRLSTAILPYVKSDAAFLSLIVSLSQIGWPLAALHSAVREAGFN